MRRGVVLTACVVAALAVAGATVAVAVSRGPALITLPTTDQWAPLTWQKPLVVPPPGVASTGIRSFLATKPQQPQQPPQRQQRFACALVQRGHAVLCRIP
jgi:hypothetical protein